MRSDGSVSRHADLTILAKLSARSPERDPCRSRGTRGGCGLSDGVVVKVRKLHP